LNKHTAKLKKKIVIFIFGYIIVQLEEPRLKDVIPTFPILSNHSHFRQKKTFDQKRLCAVDLHGDCIVKFSEREFEL